LFTLTRPIAKIATKIVVVRTIFIDKFIVL
jgi:hypothetical protein